MGELDRLPRLKLLFERFGWLRNLPNIALLVPSVQPPRLPSSIVEQTNYNT